MSIFSKSLLLLTLEEKRKATILLILMLVGMFLETLSIGLIVPAITIMMQTEGSNTLPFFNFLENIPKTDLIKYAMLALVIIYLIKNLFVAFSYWKQADFTYGVQAEMAQRLFTVYLRQPYTFHLQRNSAELVRNITTEVGVFTSLMSSILILISETLVLISITILLLSIELIGTTVIVIMFFTFALVFHRFTRKRITRWGESRLYHNGLRLKHLFQGLGSVKDVKLLGRENDFLSQHYEHSVKTFQSMKLQSVFSDFPRLLLELLAVLGLATLVVTMISQGLDMKSIIPTLGLFAAAAFRLMPSFNRVLRSVQQYRFSFPVINTLYKELSDKSYELDIEKVNNNNIFFNRELRLKNVSYGYGDSNTNALKNIDLVVYKGQSIGVIGPSGSGKSTLVDLITGLLLPTSGTIELDGVNINKNLRGWQNQIGYVPQTIYLTDDSLKRNVAFGLADEEISCEAVVRALKAAKLYEYATNLPQGLDTIVGENGVRLSGGQRQRIGIARALYHDPEVLVLDEATSALDSSTERDVMEAVISLQGKKTMIIIAHRLTTVMQCDCLYKLKNGMVVETGTPKEIII